MEPGKDRDFWPISYLVNILDLVKAGVVLLSLEGDILYANRQAGELLGEEELEGKNLKQFFDEQDRRLFWHNILAILQNEGVYEGEGFLVPRGGDGFVAQMHFLRYEPQGAEPFVVFTFQNIARLKDLERSLKEARHLAFLGRMLADISHHIRNPILVVGGLARRLKERPERAQEYASALVYQCERLEQLLQSLERFVFLPAPRFRPVEIKEVIELLESRYQLELSGERPELIMDYSISLPVFYTDPELLAEALGEIIQNALEAHQAVGESRPVFFRVRGNEKELSFLVEDYGEGLKVDSLSFIFNPFFTTKPGHFGMGLTLASRIAEMLSAEIEVLNTYQPTVFRFFQPLDRRRPERRKPFIRS